MYKMCMQAVFTSSYLHSAIIYVAVILFSIYVYSGSNGSPISSIGEVYNNLKIRSAVSLLPYCAAAEHGVPTSVTG